MQSAALSKLDALLAVLGNLSPDGPLLWNEAQPPQQQQQQQQHKQPKRQQKQQNNKNNKNQQGQQGKQGKQGKKGKGNKDQAVVEQPLFSCLDIRVGRVAKAWKHPEADTLYIEHIDLGEEHPRQVVSGLVKYITLEELIGADLLVVVNLKAANMRGTKSYGMVLAASNDDHSKVQLVRPPEGSHVGERVNLQGDIDMLDFPGLESVNGKKKNSAWAKVVPLLTTDAKGIACYNGQPMITSAGACLCDLPSAAIA